MALRGGKSITVALCFFSNHQGNRNLLCLALMSWVQFTSQLGFGTLWCVGIIFISLFSAQQGGDIIAFSTCPSPFGCPSRSSLSLSILRGSFPQSREHILSFSPSSIGWMWNTFYCCRHNTSSTQNKWEYFNPKKRIHEIDFLYVFLILKWYFKIKKINFYLEYALSKIGNSS